MLKFVILIAFIIGTIWMEFSLVSLIRRGLKSDVLYVKSRGEAPHYFRRMTKPFWYWFWMICYAAEMIVVPVAMIWLFIHITQ